MLSVLANQTYRHLFAAQVIAPARKPETLAWSCQSAAVTV